MSRPLILTAAALVAACAPKSSQAPAADATGFNVAETSTPQSLDDGKNIFRFDTFGDEKFWTDTARMHEVVQKSVDPTTALSVGLKVDADAIPTDVAAAIKAGKVDLKSPATTVTLLKLNAVVGLKGTVNTINGRDTLVRLGVTCALCHSTVDNSFAPGIGKRMDGWPNRDLDVGAIISLSPAITAAQKTVYGGWGKGKYDPRYNIDGKNTPLVLPPAYGLANVKNETYTAEGPISYWNAYVAITQMHGQGDFSNSRIGVTVRQSPDLVASKLAALAAYQHSLPTPAVESGSFDPSAAERGRAVFTSSCAGCHVGGSGTDNNSGVLHAPVETGMDGAYAARTPARAYRTTPLRGLSRHAPYFHDGSAATLEAVVGHYDRVRKLGLSARQKADLVQYLKTL